MTAKSIHIGLNNVDPNAYGGWDGQLNGCVNDANGFKSVADSLGYSSMILTNGEATAERVIREIACAAQELVCGDILWITYSGHGGQVQDVNTDEVDGMDETWVMFDREVVDDELYSLWSQFADGVRIVVLSDSCHSGTMLKMAMTSQIEQVRPRSARSAQPPKSKAMPRGTQIAVNERDKPMYDTLQYIAGRSDEQKIGASVLLISGCLDNQLSYDGDFYGQFTGAALQAWNNGAFNGTYYDYYKAVLNQLPPYQSPNYFKVGVVNQPFEDQKPFTIQCPGVVTPMPITPIPNPGANGGTSNRPTLRRGDNGPYVTELQGLLNRLGYMISADGDFGPATESAVINFQSNNMLTPDGIVGAQTWHALDNAAPAMNTPTPTPPPAVPTNNIPPQTTTNRPTLRYGDSGAAVEQLQELLVDHGYSVVVDGDFGRMTESFVRDFQRTNGLSPDGVVGPQTWQMLDALVPA